MVAEKESAYGVTLKKKNPKSFVSFVILWF